MAFFLSQSTPVPLRKQYFNIHPASTFPASIVPWKIVHVSSLHVLQLHPGSNLLMSILGSFLKSVWHDFNPFPNFSTLNCVERFQTYSLNFRLPLYDVFDVLMFWTSRTFSMSDIHGKPCSSVDKHLTVIRLKISLVIPYVISWMQGTSFPLFQNFIISCIVDVGNADGLNTMYMTTLYALACQDFFRRLLWLHLLTIGC